MNLFLPIGIEFFAKIRDNGFYYVDKTGIIAELLSRQYEATLITRPRRFGKTLTMTMLEDFFDISRDSRSHFEGLEISKNTELCEEWMNKYPTVFVSLKSVEGLNFNNAFGAFRYLISELCTKYSFLGKSDKVDASDKAAFENLLYRRSDEDTLKNSLVLLSNMMKAHYGKPVILLIDEYDVPLAKASDGGYYSEMMEIIRAFLGNALKTNPSLKFAIITGCLRISKESIFTGLNNLVTDAITGDRFNEYIGFTQGEVEKLLADAELSDHVDEAREWYDGYRFGNVEVYCPWSLLNYINALTSDPKARPRAYWANTSHNSVIYHYISRKLAGVKADINRLMDGGILVTEIEENLTYDYLKSSPRNFWSLLYLSGYLTNADPKDVPEELPYGSMALRIPNKEVRTIFQKSILEWLESYVEKIDRTEICGALWSGDCEKAQKLLSALLLKTVSYYDYRESFYHAFLAGLFAGDEYSVETNREYGFGRPDVVITDDDKQRVIVIEVKYAKTEGEIEEKLAEAQKQFADEKYIEGIPDDYTEVIGYCAIFYRKKCFLTKVN